jgi:hypothetical protein
MDPKERKRIINNAREFERRVEGQEGYVYAAFLSQAETPEQFEMMWRVTQRAATQGRKVGVGSVSGYSGRGGVQVGSNFDSGELAAINEAALETAKRLKMAGVKGITPEMMLTPVKDGGLGLTVQQVEDMGFDVPRDIVDTGVKKVTRKQGSRPVTGIALEVSSNKLTVFRGLNDRIKVLEKKMDAAGLDEVEDYLVRGREEALIEETINKLTRESAELLGEAGERGVRRYNAATAGGLNANQYDLLLGKVRKAREKMGQVKPSASSQAAVAAIRSGDYTAGKHAYAKDSIAKAQTRSDLYSVSAAAQEALTNTKGLSEADAARFRLELNDAALAKMDELQGVDSIEPPSRVLGEDFGPTEVERQNRVLTETADYRSVSEDPTSMRRVTDRGGEFERESPDFMGGIPMDTGRKRRPRKQSSKQRQKSAMSSRLEEARRAELAKPIDQILSEGAAGFDRYESLTTPKVPGLSRAEAIAMQTDVPVVSGGQARFNRASTPAQLRWTQRYGAQALETVRSITTKAEADEVYAQMLSQKSQIEPWLYRRLAMEWREALRRMM